jgi:hypothetical protein
MVKNIACKKLGVMQKPAVHRKNNFTVVSFFYDQKQGFFLKFSFLDLYFYFLFLDSIVNGPEATRNRRISKCRDFTTLRIFSNFLLEGKREITQAFFCFRNRLEKNRVAPKTGSKPKTHLIKKN